MGFFINFYHSALSKACQAKKIELIKTILSIDKVDVNVRTILKIFTY